MLVEKFNTAEKQQLIKKANMSQSWKYVWIAEQKKEGNYFQDKNTITTLLVS